MSDNFSLHFNSTWLNRLLTSPETVATGTFGNVTYTAKIVIPNYHQRISQYYKKEINGNLDQCCQTLNFPKVFKHFAVEIVFNKAIQLRLHDDEMTMIDSLHHIIKDVGAVIIKNAYLDSKHISMGHRNRFPQLNFHVDRSEKQPTHYSMYTRNPFDEEQKQPRKSSTLFIPSVIGYLQSKKEQTHEAGTETINKGSYSIFTPEDIPELVNNIIVEHAWNEETGTGEISMLDNITCLHASYYPTPEKGYKIGVRYVA